MRAGARTLAIALLGLVLLFAATLGAYRLPPLKNAPPDEFSGVRALAILQDLVGDGVPHPIGSAANTKLRENLVARLSELHYRVELQTGLSCNRFGICGWPTNIIATLPYPVPGAHPDAVLLAAHYDSVRAGPGAADDGAGVAALLDIARLLSAHPTQHPLILLISDGEEAGLLGALLFVREHPLARNVKAAVNLEGRGDTGPSLMFETGSANSWLMGLYQKAVARPITDSLFYVVYRALPNDTDFTVFKAAGYQGFNFAYVGHVGRYHTTLDTVANMSPRTLQQQGDNALSVVVALANADSLRAPASDAVFADVFSRALLVWPSAVNLAIAALTLLLLLVEAAWFLRQDRVNLRQIAWGAAGALAGGGLAFTMSVLAMGVVWFAHTLPLFAWIAHPFGMHIACVAIALAAATQSGAYLKKRGQFWGAWFGCTLTLALLGFTLALCLPGTSFIAVLPALVAALGLAPSAFGAARATSPWRPALAVLPALWTAMLIVSPIVSLSYSALGILSWPVITLLLSLVAMLLLPLLASLKESHSRRLRAASGLAALAGLSIACVLPAYSAEWPLRLSFQYRLDSDSQQSFWIADAYSRSLPARVAQAGGFSTDAKPAYPGSASLVYFAPAPPRNLAAPQLMVLAAAARSGGGTRYRLHLQSARGASVAFVVFPPKSGIRELRVITVSGELRTPLYELSSGATRVTFVALPSVGVDFEVDSAQQSLNAQVFDQSEELSGGEFLQGLRDQDAASAQDGDVTVVQHTVTLFPAAGR